MKSKSCINNAKATNKRPSTDSDSMHCNCFWFCRCIRPRKHYSCFIAFLIRPMLQPMLWLKSTLNLPWNAHFNHISLRIPNRKCSYQNTPPIQPLHHGYPLFHNFVPSLFIEEISWSILLPSTCLLYPLFPHKYILQHVFMKHDSNASTAREIEDSRNDTKTFRNLLNACLHVLRIQNYLFTFSALILYF